MGGEVLIMIKIKHACLLPIVALAIAFTAIDACLAANPPKFHVLSPSNISPSTPGDDTPAKNARNKENSDALISPLLGNQDEITKLRLDLDEFKRVYALDIKKGQGDSGFLQFPRTISDTIGFGALPIGIFAIMYAWRQARVNAKITRQLRQELLHKLQNVQGDQLSIKQDLVAQSNAISNLRTQLAKQLQLSQSPQVLQTPLASDATLSSLAPFSLIYDDSLVAQIETSIPVLPRTITSVLDAINAGDKELIRRLLPEQLNITKASEDAIQMGRNMPTILEKVAGGGSYLLFKLSDGCWLLPTERTLTGFRSFQPAKGIFDYESLSFGEPRVLKATRVEHQGDQWVVAERGVIQHPA
jgi:hypothetical protein